ncbi:hypothetical protein WJX74_008499 [Apatococcus lobatus]|uniref:Uncharacterized protein n=1 Tax=Apatococcus lobatus TaxID=904363 RepID=A0AAW1RBA5_9CHLO
MRTHPTQPAGPCAVTELQAGGLVALPRDLLSKVLRCLEELDLQPASLQYWRPPKSFAYCHYFTERLPRERLAKAVLKRCQQLRVLDLRGAHAYTSDDTLALICSQAQRLESLLLGGCQAVTPDGLAHLTAPSCPVLEDLALNGCVNVGDASSLAALPALKRLDLAWCRDVTSSSMALLLPRLEHAVFHGCEVVTDELLEHATSVKLLDCAFTAVGDAGLHSLVQVASNLQKLILGAPTDNLWMSGNWTPLGLEAFKKQLPDVHVQLVFA